MADLILVRLHPGEQTDPGTFTQALQGLQITAYDLTVANPGQPVQIGTASGLAGAPAQADDGTISGGTVDISATQIIQDWSAPTVQVGLESLPILQLESAAIAVIVVDAPAGHPEYPTADSFDVQLAITRDGLQIPDAVVEYNATVVPGADPLPTDQEFYFGSTGAAYVTIPLPVTGQSPALTLSSKTPPFKDLSAAIDGVLADDPGDTSLVEYVLNNGQPQPLTADQCQQIAAEIIYNRAYSPPPAEPTDYGMLYTSDPAAVLKISTQDEDNARQKFEGQLTAYHATNDALATRLAGYVYAASAAVLSEQQSINAPSAGLPFPLITGADPVIDTEVVLTSPSGTLNPAFGVPAAFFYALGAGLPSSVGLDPAPGPRWNLAVYVPEAKTLPELQAAVDTGVVDSAEQFVTLPPGSPSVNIAQAARRLSSLGAVTGSLPSVVLEPPVDTLVTDWLGYGQPTTAIDQDFWAGEVTSHEAAYLNLVLQVITGNYGPLMTAIVTAVPANPGDAPGLGVSSVTQLVQIPDVSPPADPAKPSWTGLFLSDPALLPPTAVKGSTTDQISAFLRHLHKFFTVPVTAVPSSPAQPGQPGGLGTPTNDVLGQFAANYETASGSSFAFGGGWDSNALNTAVTGTLPGDTAAQAWLKQALNTIEALYELTAFADSGSVSELRFSLMEALYARGFTTKASLQALTPGDLASALDGTVAYPYATQIQTAAGGSTAPAAPSGTTFVPVNPDGSLTNCVPPAHLSPFGPVAYLSQLLRASAASTCEQPRYSDAGHQPIGALLAGRRGPLGDLHATSANLDTPLPVLDLVNESLEAMAASSGSAAGAVFDTNGTELAGHQLRPPGGPGSSGPGSSGLDPADAFAAIPEHSSPAVGGPAAETAAYQALRSDFTAPILPYDQPLDVCRSYLCRMQTSRFAAMRRFRKDITEFVLDPAPTDEPAGFQRYRLRYPVRFETALEYLGISAQEYTLLYAQPVATQEHGDGLVLPELYGFPAAETDQGPWTTAVTPVPAFLERTGLSYCELVELQRSGYLPFTVTTAASADDAARAGASLPDCEPCCLDDLRLVMPGAAGDDDREELADLYRLAVFIRLWRRLRERAWCELTFGQLAQVAAALGLFGGTPADPAVNSGFLRQLAALLMLRDDFGADPAGLLPLWAVPAAADWTQAVQLLLAGVARHARSRWSCREREPEFAAGIAANLDPLSRLAGFDPGAPGDTWHAQPVHTLRFAEVLGKVYASRFTVGEILFLFTTLDHLDGDDPFPLADPDETADDPLALPETDPAAGDGPHSLWALRRALLSVEVDEDAAREWSWHRITAALHEEFGYTPAAGGPDPLTELAAHFFPGVLERDGHTVSPQDRQYRTQLAATATTPAMWNAGPGPFRYDAAAEPGQLWVRLPLRDRDVISQLRELRPLQAPERAAVQQLHFASRVTLSSFGMIFEDFAQAVEFLVQAGSEQERFAFFQREFARFYARCLLIARHLAGHVGAAAGRPDGEEDRRRGDAAAWRVLRSLLADGNAAAGSWEDDWTQPPTLTWGPPAGGAFAALLGVCGTGLLGEVSTAGTNPAWREIRGPLSAFGRVLDEHNCPVPTVLPALDLALTPEQARQAVIRNGFAWRDADGEPLGGAEPFTARWTGVLLIERGGEYRFHAGAPAGNEPDQHEPDFEAAQDGRWQVTLSRGDKTWVVLSHGHGQAQVPAARSAPQALRRGAYQITAEFEQPGPLPAGPGEACPARTGFEVAYAGPDTRRRVSPIPRNRLFRAVTGTALGSGIQAAGSVAQFLAGQYSPDLRDIRRTYQRAFKALLFAERFGLSAWPVPGYRQSELGYLLDNPQTFEGTSYYRTGPTSFGTHHAWFDLDLLPVADPYPPQPADPRANPTPQRQAALFDWWERIFDYGWLREQTDGARERPAWLLFAEAAQQQPDEPAELLRHLGVDLRHAAQVLTYFDTPGEYLLGASGLQDERWAVRVWSAETWLRRLERNFTPHDIGLARPDLWASDDPGTGYGAPALSGNANLTGFVQDGYLGGHAPRRYREVTDLNDGLRERARAALTGYLCGMNRVVLPWAPSRHAQRPADLSGVLLQDVQTGPRTRMSRIEDAVRAVQAFVQRARLGLEQGFPVTPEFARLWDTRFACYDVWQAAARRDMYLENWIEWDDLRAARRAEAFRLLEQQLRRATLTVAMPGGGAWWPDTRPPGHPSLEVLQDREPAVSDLLPAATAQEGLVLLGAQQRAASPAWLAPVLAQATGGGNGDGDGDDAAAPGTGHQAPAATGPDLPLWLQAAAGLGAQFVRVAAAGLPPAAARFTPYDAPAGCCAQCDDEPHPVVDEYYFWLADSRYFLDTDAVQNADAGGQGSLPATAISAWEDPAQLPGMLAWESGPMVHLYWTRVRQGEFGPPRRSGEGLPVSGPPQLALAGRTADSLRFTVVSGQAPAGYPSTPGPGFRYDLAADAAVPLPLVTGAPALPAGYANLPAYPYFAYVRPGAPVEPLSPYGVATAVAGTLRTHCQFEAALNWYALAYSPPASDNTWAQCSSDDEENAVAVRGQDVPCCPAPPATAPVARDRAILLAYLETLLQWGDATSCRNSAESAEQAKVIFETLARVLGDGPVTVPAQDDGDAMSLSGFIPRPAPLNPRLISLYERCADRLALLRLRQDGHRLATERQRHDRPFWGEGRRRDGWRELAGRGEAASCQDRFCYEDQDDGLCCHGPYRFTSLVRHALELASEVRGLGAALLSAYEKTDAETLAALHAAHDRQVAELTLAAKQYTWREADWQVQALTMTKQGAQARRSYYQSLLDAQLNAGETGYVALTAVSIQARAAGNISEAIGQGMVPTPDMAIGVAGMGPLQANQLPIGNKLAESFKSDARIMNTIAEAAGTSGQLSLTQGGWDRRIQEWQLQVETIGIEIDQIQRQILAAERHRDTELRELNTGQQQIEHAIEVQDFLRDKFTSEELYRYLQQETAALYRQMYDLALHTARRAQRAFNRERGHTARRFLPEPGWENLHEALLAGERLQLAVRQMETAYLDLDCREYELTKHLSLRLDFPYAYPHLRQAGWAEIDVPEWMFDHDYAGHYMRRIKSMTLTIPCVAGPYTGVHCRLTLLSSVTRVDPRLAGPVARCCEARDGRDVGDCDCDGGGRCGDGRGDCGRCGCDHAEPAAGYLAQPGDLRFVREYAATQAMATSSGQNDAGLFELSFRDERYLPFEFAGAVSRWRIELPPETNRFDLDTVSDVVLHLNHTAREGGDMLRRAASEQAQRHLPGDGARFLDARHDLPEEWARLRQSKDCALMPLRLGREHFPYLPFRRDVRITRIELFFEAGDPDCVAGHRVTFAAAHDHDHGRDEECRCAGREIECVAGPEWPGLYHGNLDCDLPPLGQGGPRDLGEFRLPLPGHEIRQLFLIFGYAAVC